MASKEEVDSFLNQLKAKIRSFDIAFRPRVKNKEFLSESDISAIDRLVYLNKLTSDNYYKGPNRDTYDPSKPDYYEFGMEIKGIEVYIKISLGLPNKRVDCMSFHRAERSITYPLRKI